jgi:hypothetical protein
LGWKQAGLERSQLNDITVDISSPPRLTPIAIRQEKPCKAIRTIRLGRRPQRPRLGITVEEFALGKKYDVIASSGLTSLTSSEQNAGDTTGLKAQPSANKIIPGRKLESGESIPITQLGHLDPAILKAVRTGTPLFAIPQADTLSEGVAKH